MADLLLPDVSEFQSGADIAGIRRQTDAIAVRVAYGTRLDKCMPARRDVIRGQDFTVVLWYLFLRASQDVTAQVQTVINCLGNLRPGESVVIDYERDSGLFGRTPTVGQRDQAASLFEARYGRPTVIYMSASTALGNGTTRPTWIAAYQRNEPAVVHMLWQYTDKGGPWPGCGNCDTSIYRGSAQQLHMSLWRTVLDCNWLVGVLRT
jgi:GH25 family lysozyme M1 (1,4-beta-N-acetylmuramidase)